MTTIFLTKTNCTNCGKQSTFERFDRVYAVKTPDIISAILDWDFFKFTCHNCNHMVLIDYPTVVVDEEQKTIIQYCADGNVDVLSMQICLTQSSIFVTLVYKISYAARHRAA